MDLTQFDVVGAAEAGANLRLCNPFTLPGKIDSDDFVSDGIGNLYVIGGEPLGGDDAPVVLRVAGKDSNRVRAAALALEQRKMKGEKADQGEIDLELLSATIIGWSNVALDGHDLDHSAENALRILKDERSRWIVEQLSPFALGRRNFSQNMPSV